jgi:hypothetical protein
MQQQRVPSAVIRGRKDVAAEVAPKKTVRERVMETIIKTKERLAASSRQQNRYQEGCVPGTSRNVLPGIVMGEISIPVPCSNMSSSNSIKKLDEETLLIQKVCTTQCAFSFWVKINQCNLLQMLEPLRISIYEILGRCFSFPTAWFRRWRSALERIFLQKLLLWVCMS